MENFDDARTASESLFSNQAAAEAQAGTSVEAGNDGGEAADVSDIPPEVQAQQLPSDAAEQQVGLEQSTGQQTGPAQQVPAVNNNSLLEQQIAQMQQEMQAMTEQNTQLQNMVRELSTRNEQNVIERAVEMPTLDIEGLAYANDDEKRQAQTEYANQMREYVMAGIKEDPGIKGLIDEAERGRQEREKQQMIEGFRGVPELNGFEDNLEAIESFVTKNNDIFKDDTPMDVRYIIAKAVVDGVNAANKAEPGVDELMAVYNNNPDFRNAVEQQRLAAIKDSQKVPPFSASSGAANAALNIPEKPKTLNDADSMARKLFGGR